MKGLILAAGKGSRLYPVTRVIPKPLLPIANKLTIAYAFDQLKACGITDIGVVVGSNEQALRATLGDGASFGVELTYIQQPEALGLAHAVGYANDFVAGDSFSLYLGDAIYDQSLRPFVEMFKSSGCANLNLVKAVDDPRRFGVANVVGDRIVKLVEKPQNPESNLAMAGFYVFGPQLWDVLPELQPSARGEYEITDAIQLLVDKGEFVQAGLYEGVWFDTGTLDSFLETTAFLTDGGQLVAEHTRVSGRLCGATVIGEGAQVTCGEIHDSVVLPGSKINVSGKIERCILGGEIELEGDMTNTIRHGNLFD